MNLVEARNLPRHVGIIMDGNGRWAELRGEPREAGHKAGSAAVRRIVRVCRRLGVEALTLYAFSEQNWARPQNEVDALMGLLREFLMNPLRGQRHCVFRGRPLGQLAPPEIVHGFRIDHCQHKARIADECDSQAMTCSNFCDLAAVEM